MSEDSGKKAKVAAVRESRKDLADQISDPRMLELDSKEEEY
jgi:hypothetical protein